MLAAPASLYLLIPLAARRRSLARALCGTVVLCGAHGLLLTATAEGLSRARLAGPGGLAALVGRLPELTLLGCFLVPLMLVPFRDLLAPRPRSSRVSSGSRPVYPRPSRPVPAPADAPVARPAAVEAPPAPESAPPPAPRAAELPESVTPRPGAAPVVEPAPPERAGRPPAAEPVDEVVRITFVRVADQLPADAFLLPADRLAANLLEPGHLLVPQRLLLPQLAEGMARVAWGVVADQFPRQALKMPSEEIARRLAGGALVLPLDEVIRQLPPETFAPSAPAVDVRGLEDFPPPFQPHVPPPGEEIDRAPEAEAVTETPAAVGPVEGGPAAPPEAEPEAGEVTPIAGVEPEAEPSAAPATAVAAEPDADVGPVGLVLPILRTLHVERFRHDGLVLTLAVAPTLARKAVLTTALRVLPFLSDRRLPAAADQATVRCGEVAVVVTPRGPNSVLITAGDSAASLALLERWARRTTTEGERPVSGGVPGDAGDPTDPTSSLRARRTMGGVLRPAEAPEAVRAVADVLRAFGRPRPTVLRDEAARVVLYLFLPHDMAPLPVAEFARDVHGALAPDGQDAGASVTLRFGRGLLVVRDVEGGLGRTVLLVAGGATDRPGLVRVELERAVRRLAGV
jgi:hypothetical protein